MATEKKPILDNMKVSIFESDMKDSQTIEGLLIQ